MPIYEYLCEKCYKRLELVQSYNGEIPTCCEAPMERLISRISDNTKNTARSARRKWMRNWTPDSPQFQTGSLHGEKY